MFGRKKETPATPAPVLESRIFQAEIARGLPLPSYAREHDTGMDVPSAVDIVIPAFGSAEVRTGIHIIPPAGYYYRVVGKGSSAKKKLYFTLENIDHGYTGEIILHPCNSSAEDVVVKRGQCIAVIVLTKLEQSVLQLITQAELDSIKTDRGTGRMNSSGRGLV
jgi:dUTP pyrophosphatase